MVDLDKEYPVKLSIASLQLSNNGFWRTLGEEAKKNHFIDEILPRYCDLNLRTEDLEYLHRSIDFIYDTRETHYDRLFNTATIEFIIRFKSEKDILFWTMYWKDPKAKGKLIKD